MTPPAKKLNFMIRKDLAEELNNLVPPGQRSRVVNEALARELLSIKRRKLTAKLHALRARAPRVSSRDIIASLKKDRERG